MSIEQEITELASRVREAGTGKGRRYALELRSEIMGVVARGLSQGYKITALSRALSIPIQRLRKWEAAPAAPRRTPARARGGKAALRMKPVRLRGDAHAARAFAKADGVRVVLPSGIAIEGLGVAYAIELCRALA